MADIIFISPKFQDCFWGLDLATPIAGKRASLPQTVMPLLAALTPAGHRVTLMDENVEPIDYDRCARADIVGVTGMSIQRFQMIRILTRLKERGCFTVVGGPWVSSCEDYFGPMADVIFIGEVEESWPRFLGEWAAGNPAARYEQSEFSDLTKIPVPRFDLLKSRHYAFGTLQFSRGCPHRCEFCDITVMFGHRPRYKTGAQVIAELDAILASGLRFIFVVDDNLICDPGAARSVLREVVAWQHRNGYPVALITQVTVNLADDPETMALMIEANFVVVFIGIESPNPASLRETGKWQNLKTDEPLLDKLHRIQRAGFVVWCGMIQGFDHDGPDIFARQLDFLSEGHIPVVMSGMLTALGKTPLHERMAREGRLDPSDPPRYGTNIVPAGMTGEELQRGYVWLHAALYNPESYFRRLDALFLDPAFEVGFARQKAYWRKHPLRRVLREAGYTFELVLFFVRIRVCVGDPALRKEYRRRFLRLLKVHRRPGLLLNYLWHTGMQFHAWSLARKMSEGTMPVVNTY
jgi:radical SAM superfamily enzyme YgiQ (UPF0313 family)